MCHPILKVFELMQTMNFVDGWCNNALPYIEFPYWEVWSLPDAERRFFEMIKTTYPAGKPNNAVFVCYPNAERTSDPRLTGGMSPAQLRTARMDKCLRYKMRYLLIGDGEMFIQKEYFPDTQPRHSTFPTRDVCSIWLFLLFLSLFFLFLLRPGKSSI